MGFVDETTAPVSKRHRLSVMAPFHRKCFSNLGRQIVSTENIRFLSANLNFSMFMTQTKKRYPGVKSLPTQKIRRQPQPLPGSDPHLSP